MVARWLRMRTGHIKKTKQVITKLTFCTMYYQPDLWGMGGGHQIQAHGKWFSQWCLYNEISMKPLETEAQVSFIGWQYFVHVLPHIDARRVMHPWGHRSFTCGGLPIPESVLCIFSLGWFWFISFGYSNTMIIIYSPFLNSVSFQWLIKTDGSFGKPPNIQLASEVLSWLGSVEGLCPYPWVWLTLSSIL